VLIVEWLISYSTTGSAYYEYLIKPRPVIAGEILYLTFEQECVILLA